MEELQLFSCAIILLVFVIAHKLFKNTKLQRRNLPPSPPSLPIIGHLHMLKEPLHKTIHEICTKYGEVLLLKLGVRRALIIASPSAVEECLLKNDTTFANRPDTLVGRLLHYNSTSIAFSPYNGHYRTLRRVMTQEVFSSTKVPLFSGIRQAEVRLLLRDIWEECTTTDDVDAKAIHLNRGFRELALNIMTNMVAGKRYYGKDVEDVTEAKRFSEIIREGAVLHGAANPGDLFPMLKWMFRGLEKRMVTWMKSTDAFYQRLLDERKQTMSKDDTRAIVDVLIKLQQQDPAFFTNEVIKGMIMVLVLAGADTSSATMEWAMALLLNNPDSLKKVQEEIDTVIGHNRLINEEDVAKLPYLQNIVMETLRLYPPTPLLLPHETSEDCNICGYEVPRGTMLMVSLWTLHRDARWWNEPEKFIPERFEGKEGESLYKLLPFGLGRRNCPGYAMGKRAVALVLGSVLQCFDWKRPSDEMLDMSQSSGITMPKAQPLEAFCTIRPCMADLLSKELNC
ncbi:hypothetical protein Cgig2_021314 [Carnegiea gigantea]|uniref:Cytochrome P450 n=1 Tax=Carnegiea gigantea TaxID=171969 RepID=A0A9Q1KKL7_9CARY|nr:hypothetical protein Cgig2_021314 [Carnegiea gigantea]